MQAASETETPCALVKVRPVGYDFLVTAMLIIRRAETSESSDSSEFLAYTNPYIDS